jgi:hypothetical protein
MTPDRKAALRAELDELADRALPDELTPAQEAWADTARACWGGTELTPPMWRWAARQLHLPEAQRRRAISSVYTSTAAAMKGLA